MAVTVSSALSKPFAALDMFKVLQGAVRGERPANLRFAPPLDEARLPPAATASAQQGAAILARDARAAEHATAAMVRAGAVDASFSELFLYGGRDLGAAHNTHLRGPRGPHPGQVRPRRAGRADAEGAVTQPHAQGAVRAGPTALRCRAFDRRG